MAIVHSRLPALHIQLMSDLHLERHPAFRPSHAPGSEVLVLAGDIGSYQQGSLLEDQDFGLGRFSPLAPDCPWREVVFVPGNHEYDGLPWQQTRERLRALCARLGMVWLDETEWHYRGVRFLGTTLWSDFDSVALAQSVSPRDAHGKANPVQRDSLLTRQLAQREKAFRAANYYLSKNTTVLDGQPMLAESMRALGLGCQRWLTGRLEQVYAAGPTVVVTHFAPSLRSRDPRYGMTPGTAGFCNAMDAWLPYADLWLHGHLHCPADYLVSGERHGKVHTCRVVANPYGYAEKNEQAGFQPAATLTLALPS